MRAKDKGMKFLEKIKETKGLTEAELTRMLIRAGYNISTAGLNRYAEPESVSIRLDILVGLKQASGFTWNKLGELIEEEFNAEAIKTKPKRVYK